MVRRERSRPKPYKNRGCGFRHKSAAVTSQQITRCPRRAVCRLRQTPWGDARLNIVFRQARRRCHPCHYHIRALRHIRPLLTLDTAKSMAVAIVGIRLDYCNSVLYAMSQAKINRLL